VSCRPRILYYAHQHGSGHVRHAARLAATGAFELTVVTASEQAGRLLPPGTRTLKLPPDLVPDHRQAAGSTLHYTPAGPVIRDRFAALWHAARDVDPDAVVVDVSVEAALFLRLAGYPVIYRRMQGDRGDPGHELAYAEAHHLVAYHGPTLEDPDWRRRFAEKTTFLGVPDDGGRLGAAVPVTRRGRHPRIAVVTGTGGDGVHVGDLVRAAQRVPGARWAVYGPVRGTGTPDGRAGRPPSGSGRPVVSGTVPPNLELHGWSTGVEGAMRAADLVVVSAGYNAVAEAAASRRPVVLAPEERPFDEQVRFARAAHRVTGVPWCRWGDEDADWDGAVSAALSDPAAADRLASAVLTEPADYRARWERTVRAALEDAAVGP
jgi:predicted glycosyltransferase